jgi:hypothetical protein
MDAGTKEAATNFDVEVSLNRSSSEWPRSRANLLGRLQISVQVADAIFGEDRGMMESCRGRPLGTQQRVSSRRRAALKLGILASQEVRDKIGLGSWRIDWRSQE